MAGKFSIAYKNTVLQAAKDGLDGGFIFLFAGPVPEDADVALDMVTLHTELGKITESDDGVTGLTFAAPADGVMLKNASETWSCTTAFDGAESAEATLTPTFFRHCTDSDNGRGAANETTGIRIQGTLSGPGGGGDIVLGTATLAEGVLQGIGDYSVDVP